MNNLTGIVALLDGKVYFGNEITPEVMGDSQTFLFADYTYINSQDKRTNKAQMEWTTEKPTGAGLYWAYSGVEVVPVNVSFDRGICEIHGLGDYYSEMMVYDSAYFSHWMGPLQAPEPPKATA